jgi:hypothetical protein
MRVKQLITCLKGIDDILYYQGRKRNMWSNQALNSGSKYGFDTCGWANEKDLEKAYNCFEVLHITEQAPDPNNRITLGETRDRLGCRKPQLYWRWNDIDVRSVQRSQEIFSQEFAKAGIGTMKLEQDKGMPHVFITSIHHHMGGTRMNEDPRQGVVDANCKVHGVSNLFVASSSVFPTGGYANPTLTIAALAIRLADHIKLIGLPLAMLFFLRAGVLLVKTPSQPWKSPTASIGKVKMKTKKEDLSSFSPLSS